MANTYCTILLNYCKCAQNIFHLLALLVKTRVGTSLIGFLSDWIVFCEWKSERAIRLWKRANLCCRAFVLSDLSESLIVTLFKRTTGVNRLQSLFCSEWHERFIGFAHYRSLKKSDWAVLSKRAKSKWAKSEFPTLVKINMQILTALKICLNCKYFKLIF